MLFYPKKRLSERRPSNSYTILHTHLNDSKLKQIWNFNRKSKNCEWKIHEVDEKLTLQLMTIYPLIIMISSSGWKIDTPAHHHVLFESQYFIELMKSWPSSSSQYEINFEQCLVHISCSHKFYINVLLNSQDFIMLMKRRHSASTPYILW